jgi:hypothetical protein
MAFSMVSSASSRLLLPRVILFHGKKRVARSLASSVTTTKNLGSRTLPTSSFPIQPSQRRLLASKDRKFTSLKASPSNKGSGSRTSTTAEAVESTAGPTIEKSSVDPGVIVSGNKHDTATMWQRFLGPKPMPERHTAAWYREMLLICTVFGITGSTTMLVSL